MPKSKAVACQVCGARFELRPQTCPLCGTEMQSPRRTGKPVEVEDYQANVRELRRRLKQLRSADGP